jgi:hypothetical protein
MSYPEQEADTLVFFRYRWTLVFYIPFSRNFFVFMRKKILIFLTILFGLITVVSGYWLVESQKVNKVENQKINTIEQQDVTEQKIQSATDENNLPIFQIPPITNHQSPITKNSTNTPTTSTPQITPKEQFTNHVTLQIDQSHDRRGRDERGCEKIS